MRSPSSLSVFFSLLALVLAASVRAEPATSDPRLAAACAVAFGRFPLPGDTATFPAPADATFADLLALARSRLATDAALRSDTARRAFHDAFGRPPTASELPADSAPEQTYSEQVTRHLATLATAPAAYREVLDRAYQKVVRRPAFEEEIAYWRDNADGALSFVLLVGCLDDWARRNQPGLMVTTGVPTVSINSAGLRTLRVTAALAAEIRAATAPVSAADAARALAASRNLIAPGANRITTAGGMHFLAIGADD